LTVFSLAQKTGWSVDYILWEIPLAILSQANHVFLCLTNIRTKRAGTKKARQIAELSKILGV
jgi:hypothetical protein